MKQKLKFVQNSHCDKVQFQKALKYLPQSDNPAIIDYAKIIHVRAYQNLHGIAQKVKRYFPPKATTLLCLSLPQNHALSELYTVLVAQMKSHDASNEQCQPHKNSIRVE